MDDLRIKDIEDAYDLRMSRLVDEYTEKSRRDTRRFCSAMIAVVSILTTLSLLFLVN